MGYRLDKKKVTPKTKLDMKVYEIDFGGHLKARLIVHEDGTIKVTNAVDGWGKSVTNFTSIEEL